METANRLRTVPRRAAITCSSPPGRVDADRGGVTWYYCGTAVSSCTLWMLDQRHGIGADLIVIYEFAREMLQSGHGPLVWHAPYMGAVLSAAAVAGVSGERLAVDHIMPAPQVDLNGRTLRKLQRALRTGQQTIERGWQSAHVESARPIIQTALAMVEHKLGFRIPPCIGEPNLDCRYGIGLLQEIVPLVASGEMGKARDRAEAFSAEVRRNWNL